MRCLCVLMLVALLHDIFGLHQIIPSGRPDSQVAFVVIDACYASSAQAEAGDEAAFTGASSTDAMPRPAILSGDAAGSSLTEFLLIYREERPPKT